MGSYLSSEQPSDSQDDYKEENTQRRGSSRMDVNVESLRYPTPAKCRKPLVTILGEILREKIKLDDELSRENNAILREFLDSFILEMKKQDKMFASLYQKNYYTGSYYSNLRITKPDEFDLNLVLKFPFKPSSVKVEYHSQVPSYAKYFVTDQSCITRENGLSKFFENGYLIPNEVRKWLQSVVDKTVTNYRNLPRRIVRIKRSAAGPARTITLLKGDGSVIDIDLVPAIECSMTCKPPGINGKVYEKVKNKLQCFLVPKPYQPTGQAPVNAAECARLWRTHYPDAEEDLIHNLQCVKPIIKLLKLLRDKENWKILASYYLKTVIMWKIFENPNPLYWRLDHIGERLMDALKTLADNVQEKKICYFFSSRYNLLEKLSDDQAHNIHNRLCHIIRDIESNPRNLWGIFGCDPTFNY